MAQSPRHNELRPDLFEKILVLASDAVGEAPGANGWTKRPTPAGVGQLVHPKKAVGFSKGNSYPKMALIN